MVFIYPYEPLYTYLLRIFMQNELTNTTRLIKYPVCCLRRVLQIQITYQRRTCVVKTEYYVNMLIRRFVSLQIACVK